MDPADLVQRFPRLYHMAADGSWPNIAHHGLLSVTALLDLFEISDPLRSQLEAQRRPDSVLIEHPVHGQAVIRDNKPLLESRLAGCLQGGMTAEEWYRLLNARTFFWPTRKRVDTLLGAAAYRAAPQIVITISTERLVAARHDAICLSIINSGATRPFAWPRGPDTFIPLVRFDFAARKRYGKSAIAELTVDYAVKDMLSVTERVDRHFPDGASATVWIP